MQHVVQPGGDDDPLFLPTCLSEKTAKKFRAQPFATKSVAEEKGTRIYKCSFGVHNLSSTQDDIQAAAFRSFGESSRKALADEIH